MSKFTDYTFKESTKAFIEQNGFVEPTPIQQKEIPLICKGKDVIGISDTGTGKTHAFLIPIIERINPELNEVQVVITAPTRELALQLYMRASDLSDALEGCRVRLISGGIDKNKQNSSLKVQPHIVIGTPGRIKDLFLNDQTLRIEKASLLVIDEADMTLEFGLLEDIDAFAAKMRKDLQMLSFSATVPAQLQVFLKKYMHAPVTVKIEDNNHRNAPKIEHIAVPCKHLEYEEKLLDVLKGFKPYVCLIFANTRQTAAKVAQSMRENGYDLIELHGDMPSRARKNAMKNLMNLDKTYIVASDIAARGIDIKGVSHVISLGYPSELDFYIHRAGRCGRAGMSGVCYSLYKTEDEQAMRQLSNKGIGFKYQNIKDGEWVDLRDKNKPKERKATELDIKINKIVNRKKVKVKPGYKKKRKEEVEKLKRKAKRAMIQDEIQKQKKERAIANQIKKRGLEE